MLSVVLTLAALVQPTADTLTIRPGDPALDGSGIRPFSVRWEQVLVHSDGEEEHMRHVDEVVETVAGDERLLRSQRFQNPDGTGSTQWNLLERATLAPVRWHEHAPRGATHLDFHGALVTGSFVSSDPRAPAVLVHRELEEAVFDQRSAALLLAALDLPPGTVGRFPTAPLRPPAISEPTLSPWIFTVGPEELVDSPALGPVRARRIDTESTLTYWIVPTPPHVIQVAFPLRGDTSVFRLVEVH